jgi:hypothetical protein
MKTVRPFQNVSKRNLWILILVLLVLNFFSPKGLFRWLMTKQEIIRLEAKSGEIESDIANIRRELQEFKKSPVAKERAIRSELGLMKPGEWSVEFPIPDNEVN